ncbi:MAG: hypothetical protein DME16_11345 [Candidatus Rokuibacteriota bacterium]|nr:MAG: hypothetical protein DME16_11345 [Candidatus Rokubacteria bacterium]
MSGGRSTSCTRSPRERDLVRHLSTDLRLPALQRLPWEPGPRRFSSRWPTVRTRALQDALDLRYLRVLARWRVHQGAKQMPIASQLAPQIEQFIHDNPQGVLTSFRRNGMPQLSIVTVYPRDGGVGISITETRMKFKNLLRDPRCSVLISHVDWWSGFLVFEGKAELTHSGNTDPDTLRMARRHIFSATTRRRSADWDEYDRIANEDKRVAMLLRPDHVYGSALARMRAALAK